MDGWAKATPKDREALFNQTASMKGISPEIVEKDFWVCWTLYQIFQLQGLPRLIFKGGTSLSKAFGIIKRFSEDIDLVINRHELGFSGTNDPANQQRTNLRGRTIEMLKSTCRRTIADEFAPRLRAQIGSIIGGDGWTLEIDPAAPDRDTVEFKYLAGLADSRMAGTIKRAVRLELGCRGDQVPFEQGKVTPYAAEAFPDQFLVREATVSVLGAERNILGKGHDAASGILSGRSRQAGYPANLPPLPRRGGHLETSTGPRRYEGPRLVGTGGGSQATLLPGGCCALRACQKRDAAAGTRSATR